MRTLIAIACVLCSISCSSEEEQFEIIHSGLDSSIDPGHNFYKYVNQPWMDSSEPGVYPASFSGVVQDTMKARFFKVLEKNLKNKPEFDYLEVLKNQFFDWDSRDSLGFDPLKKEMEFIFGDGSCLATIFARMQKRGYVTPFDFHLEYSGDAIYSNLQFGRESNASLRRYLDKRQSELADSVVLQILQKGGLNIGEMDIDILMSLKKSIKELKIARNGRIELSMEAADSILSNFDLPTFAKNFYSQSIHRFALPPYHISDRLNSLFEQYNEEYWILLLKFNVIYDNLSLLAKRELEFVTSFNPRVSNQNYYSMICRLYLTRVLAKAYEERYLKEENLEQVEVMIHEIQNEFYKKISSSVLLSEVQKNNLKTHIENIHFNYRIPDTEFFKGSYTVGDNLLETVRIISTEFTNRYNNYVFEEPLNKKYLIDPVDYYISYRVSRNMVNIPFPFLMYPYYDGDQPMALNYGALGFYIGHEIGHSFDPNSLYFDFNSVEAFYEARRDLIAQYNGYSIVHGSVDGRLTLGENWSDIVGMECALNAFLNSEYYDPTRVTLGYNDLQWLFLSRAFVERRNSDAEFYENYLANDEHSPPETRINATFRNLDQFYEVFEIDASDSLYLTPEKRVRIW